MPTLSDLKPISGSWYNTSFHAPSLQMRIAGKDNGFSMYVPMFSSCDQPGKRDAHKELSDFKVVRKGSTTVLTFRQTSTLWESKLFTVEFGPRNIKYYYTVFGKGTIERAQFFHSWYSEPELTVEDELGVVPSYDTVFSPAVNFMGKVYHFVGDTSIITVGDEPMYWGTGLMAAPYCFAFNRRGDKPWVWAGLGVRPGQYTFEQFTYNANTTKRVFGAGGFDCNYYGKQAVDGQWQSPHLVLGISDDPYRCLEDYVAVLEKGYGPKLGRNRRIPKWWKTPIYCPWGEQMSLGFRDHANFEGTDVAKYCTQAMHDEGLAILRNHDIIPGQMIIDAGWERPGTTGDMYVSVERWPDLRGWIDARRKEGLHVWLWMCAWNKAGVPDDECITNAQGTAIAPDPTNPRYEKRLRAMIRRLVSEKSGCLNAEGLKIDGEMLCPTGSGLKNHANLWGLELQRHYLGIIRDEAKSIKKDAVIGTYSANPYLADICDVGRAADLFSVKASPQDTMFHRARVMRIAQPGCPIDTDHTYWYDIRDNWIDIAQAGAECGIPCIYHHRYVWHKHPFVRPYMEEMTEQHYKVISQVFKSYWKKLAK